MMIIKLPQQPELIYESPDKGHTVYARKIGTSERILVHKKYPSWVDRYKDWQDIIKAAEINPALNDLIKKAEIIYALIKEENN
jgi:hypothetical protein